MIDEPVAYSSPRRTKPNSLDDQTTSSSAMRDRWVMAIAAAAATSC